MPSSETKRSSFYKRQQQPNYLTQPNKSCLYSSLNSLGTLANDTMTSFTNLAHTINDTILLKVLENFFKSTSIYMNHLNICDGHAEESFHLYMRKLGNSRDTQPINTIELFFKFKSSFGMLSRNICDMANTLYKQIASAPSVSAYSRNLTLIIDLLDSNCQFEWLFGYSFIYFDRNLFNLQLIDTNRTPSITETIITYLNDIFVNYESFIDIRKRLNKPQEASTCNSTICEESLDMSELIKFNSLLNKFINFTKGFTCLFEFVINQLKKHQIVDQSKELSVLRNSLIASIDELKTSEHTLSPSVLKRKLLVDSATTVSTSLASELLSCVSETKADGAPSTLAFEPTSKNAATNNKELFIYFILDALRNENYKSAIEYMRTAKLTHPSEFRKCLLCTFTANSSEANGMSQGACSKEVLTILLLVCQQMRLKYPNMIAVIETKSQQQHVEQSDELDRLVKENNQTLKILISNEPLLNEDQSIIAKTCVEHTDRLALETL